MFFSKQRQKIDELCKARDGVDQDAVCLHGVFEPFQAKQQHQLDYTQHDQACFFENHRLHTAYAHNTVNTCAQRKHSITTEAAMSAFGKLSHTHTVCNVKSEQRNTHSIDMEY